MTEKKMEHSYTLMHLLVTEAIRELDKQFEGTSEKSVPIESHLFEFGKKPGFALVGLLSKGGQDFELEDIPKFIANRVAPVVLGCPAHSNQISNKVITLQFKKTSSSQMPQWFTALSGSPSPQQQLWIKAYSSFYMGVFTGALTHMGYYVTPKFEFTQATLDFKFTIEELDPKKTWEFVCMNN